MKKKIFDSLNKFWKFNLNFWKFKNKFESYKENVNQNSEKLKENYNFILLSLLEIQAAISLLFCLIEW